MNELSGTSGSVNFISLLPVHVEFVHSLSPTFRETRVPLPQQSPRGYEFPDAAEDFLSAPVAEAFTCEARPYGYYADVANNCEVFHICLPLEDAEGNVIDYAQWSFVCGNTTIFDQQGGNAMAFILERVALVRMKCFRSDS